MDRHQRVVLQERVGPETRVTPEAVTKGFAGPIIRPKKNADTM